MDFSAFPPEVNSMLMYSGPGGSSLTAAASAWSMLQVEISEALTSLGAAVDTISWQGPSADMMHQTALRHIEALTALSAQASQLSASTHALNAAYQSAYLTTVPPAVIAENRTRQAALIATNLLGQNTPAILAGEAHYMEMWAQDATAMSMYQAGAAAATGGWDILAPNSDQDSTGLTGLLNLISGSTHSSLGALINSNLGNSIFSSGWFMPSQSILPAVSLAALGPAFAGMAGRAVPPLSEELPDRESIESILHNGGGARANDYRPSGLSRAPYAATATAGRVGGLSVPQSWTSTRTPLVTAATPIVSEGAPAMMAPPLIGTGGDRATSERPKYGFPVKVLPQVKCVG